MFHTKVTYCDKEPSLLPFQFMSYLPLIDLKNGFWPVVHLLYGISEWNFTDMLIIKGYILWLRIDTLTFPDCELSTLDWSENWFLACSFFCYMEYLNETSQICWTSKVTYCDKEPSLLPFQFMSYLPLIDLKNGFWPVVHLLYGISEWNFTDMLIIKGYILWLRIVTLTFPDCELSTLDWSENWFLACSFFCYMEYLNETSQICWTSKVTYCDKEPSLLPFQFMSYLPLIDLKNGFWPVVHLLYGISEWNFTDMLIIKGYILWLRIVTLTFPDCELSTLDWSENWFLACSFFCYMEYLNETSQICWTSKVSYF